MTFITPLTHVPHNQRPTPIVELPRCLPFLDTPRDLKFSICDYWPGTIPLTQDATPSLWEEPGCTDIPHGLALSPVLGGDPICQIGCLMILLRLYSLFICVKPSSSPLIHSFANSFSSPLRASNIPNRRPPSFRVNSLANNSYSCTLGNIISFHSLLLKLHKPLHI